MAKSNFIVRGGLDMSNFNKGLNKTQAQLGKFQSTVNKSMKFVGLALGSLALGKLVKDSTKMAMSVESAMDNISRNMGSASKSYELFANTQSKALGMARKDAYGYGSTFSNLLGSFLGGTQEVASETENLMKAAAIISSKTGRTFDDTANRIRSGMLGSTESIEDLGVYTQVSMLESTKAFQKFANGKSWAQLDFKLQQQIRLAAILEQTYDRYGDTLADTTQTKQAMFLASLDNIRLNFGQAFLPIYNTVLPALTALAGKLEAITSHLAAFSMSVFGKASSVQVIEEQSEAITDQGNAIEQAGKQAKKAIAPFDEINMLTSGKAGAGTGTIGGGGVRVEPVTTEASDKTGTFNDTIEKLKEKLEPTVKALGRFKDALEPIGKLAFDNIKSFYNDTLKPIGSWVLGDGLPRLLDVGSGLLNSINWGKLSDALKNLNQALAPFTISVGTGLINFIETMGEILKPILATASDLLAKGINAIAKAIKAIPEEAAIAIGGAIGGIATAILLFNGATAIAGIVKSIGGGIGGMLATISAHPVLAIATGIAALAGAVLALNKAKFDKSDVGKYVIELDKLIERSKDYNDEIDTMLANHDQKKADIEAEYGAVSILADKYLALADQTNLNNEEQALLKTYADQLIERIPELSGLIDEQTGAYKGTKEEIQSLITKTKEYYLVQAAQESLIEIAKKQYESTRELKELEDKHAETIELINQKRAEYESIAKAGAGADRSATAEQKEAAKQTAILDQEIFKLEKSQKDLSKQIGESRESQKKLSKEWDYATDYITDYSTDVEKSMKTVETSVNTALESVRKKVSNFRLPDILIKARLDFTGNQTTGAGFVDGNIASINRKIQGYATGGFPATGDLFRANEDGPELIGKMGNRTAVANTDQIVNGITKGVSVANAEEVSLLKQQNSLLQAILQKTGITSKSIYDTVVTENNSQYKRAGRSPLLV